MKRSIQRSPGHCDECGSECAKCSGAALEAFDLREVLRAMISTGNLTPSLQCMAMNALEPGSGQAWLDRLDAQERSGDSWRRSPHPIPEEKP